jgi:hypothetical protein
MRPLLRCIASSSFVWILAIAAVLIVSSETAVLAQTDKGPTAQPSALTPEANKNAGDAALEKTHTRVYLVADILADIQNKRHLDAAAAQEYLRNRVQGPPVLQFDMAERSRVRIDLPRWLKDDLIVVANQAGHEQVTAMLAAFRKFGVGEYTISIRFIALSEELAQKVLSESTSTFVIKPQNTPSGITSETPAVLETPETPCVATTLEARMVIDEDIRYRVLDKDGEAELHKIANGDRRSNVLEAPLLTTFSGQTASLSDIAPSQFIVGATSLPSGKQELKTRNVSEGTSIRLKPAVETNGDLCLDFAASFTKIEAVATEKIKLASGEDLTLRIPKVSKLSIEGGVAMKPGQSLLLGSVKGFSEAREVSWKDKWLGGWLLPKESTVHRSELFILIRLEPYEPASK